MQAKDIPEKPILALLQRLSGEWCFMFSKETAGEHSIFVAMPRGTPYKVALAKMRSLIKRGLVDGCPCGCRGDFEITALGRQALETMTKAKLESSSQGVVNV